MTSLTSAAITTTEQQQQPQQTMCQLIELSAIRRLLNPRGGRGKAGNGPAVCSYVYVYVKCYKVSNVRLNGIYL